MLIFVLLPIFCIVAYSINQGCRIKVQKPSLPLDPSKTTFVFDIHGVLLKHNFPCMIAEFYKSKAKWAALKTVLHPYFIYHMITVSWHRTLAEALFLYFADITPGTERAEVWQLFMDIANCQHVNWPMIDIAHQLKDLGFRLAILSNISDEAYYNIKERHPTIFALFDPVVTASPYKNFITKPNPQIYRHLLEELTKQSTVLFIDDTQKNLCGSLPFGITALKYTNIDRFKEQLAHLGIYLD